MKATEPLHHLTAFQECVSWQSVKAKLPGISSGHANRRFQADHTSFRYNATSKYTEYLQVKVSGSVCG